MIYEYPPNIYNKLKKLKGYIHTKTVHYIYFIFILYG